MVNKKYLLLAGLFYLTTQASFAQESQSSSGGAQWANRDMTYRGKNYDVLDTAYIPKSRMKQQRMFLNHQYDFPAKPRNMWEVGVNGGLYNVHGRVPSLMPWNKGGFGLGAQVRKAWGYMFSTRLQYNYGIAKGLDWQPTTDYAGPYTSLGYFPSKPGALPPEIFRAYRMESHQLNLDLIVNAGNISFNRARNFLSPYAFFGVGALAYKTRINALNSDYQPYDFASIITGKTSFDNHKSTWKKLQSAMDNTYESPAQTADNRATIFDNKTLDWVASFGIGVEIKLSTRVNIQLEDRLTLTEDRFLDGTELDTRIGIFPTISSDKEDINYFSVGINFNLGNKKKMVEPLYWMNPLDFTYNELGNPRHMKLPTPILPDEDGDGVTDQFDKCPHTPAGVQVDVHGCPLDTDGDGVPDYRDKQLITPTECQPVDADGVGKCPCPESCKDMIGKNVVVAPCSNIYAGSISFAKNSTKLSADMQSKLATLTAQMQANPNCKIVLTGAGNASKVEQERSWEHVNAVIEYMSEKMAISRERFIFQYGKEGDPNTVMFRSANDGEEGPTNVPPPFPNLKGGEKEKKTKHHKE